MPTELALVHTVLIAAMILLLGIEENHEHGNWDHLL